MTLQELTEMLMKAQGFVAGKRIKFDLVGLGHIMLDGINNTVSNDDGDADATIRAQLDDLMAVARGEINPMAAVFSGKLKVEGDTGAAMKLGDVLKGLMA